VVTDRKCNHSISRIGNTRHSRVCDQRNRLALLHLHDEFCRAGQFVMFVVTRSPGFDPVMRQKLLRLSRVFTSNQINFFQNPYGSESDVLKVPDGSCYEIKRRFGGNFRHAGSLQESAKTSM